MRVPKFHAVDWMSDPKTGWSTESGLKPPVRETLVIRKIIVRIAESVKNVPSLPKLINEFAARLLHAHPQFGQASLHQGCSITCVIVSR